jgi:hypothetical protein
MVKASTTSTKEPRKEAVTVERMGVRLLMKRFPNDDEDFDFAWSSP